GPRPPPPRGRRGGGGGRRAPPGETTRWRGWRNQDWDEEPEGEPEPEPDEDMMHTMAIDMRGYLDDTGSFRMP
ncbi:hypothetical protein I6A84_24320, partial [Frankia sp. CNm7]|nr:hypothetical protein [Frankia nepalensis]